MRPLKLTLSAFGPYAKEEIIDFTKLEGKNIFLITGVTGAGKTTIFDAISYALFGEASGTSREATSLRSHFANNNIYTYVELEFEVRGNLYYIKRSPEQEVAKLRGEGTTKKSSIVELRLPKGDKPITKVNEVNEKIKEIIGVDKEQFRQIVMLPQGEFRQLLEAKSNIREEIFREIFGTQAFLKIQRNLRERRSNLQDELKITNSKRDVYIKSLKAPQNNLLNVEKEKADIDVIIIKELAREVILNDQELSKSLGIEIENLKKEITSIEKEIALINENNNKILKKENAEKKLNEHKKREEEINRKIVVLNKGKKALEVKVIDDNKIALEKKIKIRLENLEKARYKEKLYKEEYDKAINNLKVNNEEEKLRDDIKEEIVRLNPYEEKIKIYEEKKKIVLKQDSEIKSLKLQKENCDKEINLLKQSITELTEKITKGIECEGKYRSLEILVENNKSTKEILVNLYKNYNEYFCKQSKYEHGKKETLKKEEDFKKQREEYQEKENLFRKAQAGILAENLKENMPCPVCGSTNHPNKSKKIVGVPTEEELKNLKVNTENKEKCYTDSLLKLKTLKVEKETLLKSNIEIICNQNKRVLGEDFFDIVDLKVQQEFIKEIGIKLKNKINCNEHEIINLKNILLSKVKSEKDKEIKEKELQKKEMLFNELIEKITDSKTVLASELQILKSIEKEIPENLRDLKVVKEKINVLKLKLDKSEKELKLAQERVNSATTNYSSAKENLNLSIEEKKQILNEYDNEKIKLETILKVNEFANYEDFKKSYLDKSNINLLEKDINRYKENYKVLLAILEECCTNAKDLKNINTVDLQQNVLEKRSKETELNKELSNIKARILTNKENLKKINEISNDIKIKEDEFRIVADLENISYGDKGNLKKITFESYVLTSYFD
ncbi:MAG: AAA family ATPase, partial [Sarcina sp.]